MNTKMNWRKIKTILARVLQGGWKNSDLLIRNIYTFRLKKCKLPAVKKRNHSLDTIWYRFMVLWYVQQFRYNDKFYLGNFLNYDRNNHENCLFLMFPMRKEMWNWIIEKKCRTMVLISQPYESPTEKHVFRTSTETKRERTQSHDDIFHHIWVLQAISWTIKIIGNISINEMNRLNIKIQILTPNLDSIPLRI